MVKKPPIKSSGYCGSGSGRFCHWKETRGCKRKRLRTIPSLKRDTMVQTTTFKSNFIVEKSHEEARDNSYGWFRRRKG